MGKFLAYFRARVLLANMSKKGNDFTVICLRNGPLELVIMEAYVNRITLILADHNCCMIIYTQFSKTCR